MKTTKTLIQTLIYTQVLRRLHRALTKAKSFLSQATHAKNKYQHKLRLGSFRLHYNWSCSVDVDTHPAARSELSGYLQWLEDNNNREAGGQDDDEEDRFYSARHDDDQEDIDKLAELFISTCRDKFLIEKQESYRRFQDMLARSL